MTAHELARLLMTLPDRPVILHGESDYPNRIVGAFDGENVIDETPAICLTWNF